MDGKKNYLQEELYALIKTDDKIFDFLQNSSLDGLWYWDLEHPENEWMNDKFWQVLGYNPEDKQHLASEWQTIINQEDLALATDNFERHLQDPTHPYDQLVRYQHKNGSTVWIRCRGMAIRNGIDKPTRMIGAHTDITKLKELEQKYRRNIKELDKSFAVTKLAFEESEKLFEMAPDANFKVDQYGNIVKSNIQATALFGYSKEEFEQLNIADLMPEQARHHHQPNVEQYFKQGGARRMGAERGNLKALKKDGTIITVEITLNLIDTAYGKKALATVRDVTEKEKLICSLKQQVEENKKLEALALIDPLTKVHNHRHFDDVFAKAFSDSIRHQTPLSLMVIDIDDFKGVNDKYGHVAGNEVLQQLTQLCKSFIRYGDTLCRIGGEEFAIILPHTDVESASVIAERIVFGIEQHKFNLSACGNTRITISIGVSHTDNNDKQHQCLFERADSALYQSKNQGKNRVTSID